MDRNFLLACALSFLVISLWASTQAPRPQPSEGEGTSGESRPAVEQPAGAAPGHADPGGAASRYPELPEGSAGSEAGALEPRARTGPAADAGAERAERIAVESELWEAELSSAGATLRSWRLREYTDAHGDPVHLVDEADVDPSLATPFLELGLGDLADAVWRVERRDDKEIAFAISRGGLVVRKIYRFGDGGYDFRLSLEVENAGERPVAPAFLAEWPIEARPGNDFRELGTVALANGDVESELLAGLGSPGFFGRLGGAEGGQPIALEGEIDWAGIQTPYFLAALFPDQPASARGRFVPIEAGERGVVQVYFEPLTLPPGQRAAREYRVYVGPKEVARLEAFAPSATAAIDLGWSFIEPMTRGFVWLLAVLHSFVPNYGIAIILLTILVRAVTAPLTIKQMKSMERMRRIQPKLKEIQERFKDDRQKQSEAMMSLYRQEKVNPLGGCLPMVLQLPVFIGLFYALRSSIQLRHAPFVAWIDDLSAPDLLFTLPGVGLPVRVLPLLMGASMYVQQKITPMQIDPAQAKMMLVLMPVMMTVISYQFPSGLVLYWMLSNVLAIGHQLWIGRRMSPATA